MCPCPLCVAPGWDQAALLEHDRLRADATEVPPSSPAPPAAPGALLPLRQPPQHTTVHQADAGGPRVTRHGRQRVGGGRARRLMCNRCRHLSPVPREAGREPGRQPGWLPGAGGLWGSAAAAQGLRGDSGPCGCGHTSPAQPALPASQVPPRPVFLPCSFLEPNGSCLPARGLQPALCLVSGDGTSLQSRPTGTGDRMALPWAAVGAGRGTPLPLLPAQRGWWHRVPAGALAGSSCSAQRDNEQ